MKPTLVFIFLFFPFLIFSNAKKEKLKAFIQKMDTFQAEFVQKEYNAIDQSTTEVKGMFYLKKPFLMRWEYTEPDPYLVIIGEKKSWFYDTDIQTVSIQNSDELNGIETFAFLNSPKKIEEDYEIIQTNEANNIISLKPKQSSEIKNIQLSFNQDYTNIDSITILESNDDYRQFIFSQASVNLKIKQSLFKFIIKDGIEVIQEN